jgi:uncharacterized membrane protein YfcA
MKTSMDPQTLVILVLIGIFAGFISGMVGVGGGVIIVPALVYFFGLTQHQAIGTSLFILLLPVGILAVIQYAKQDNINWVFGISIALTFVVGSYFGSKLSLKMSTAWIKIAFGIFILFVALKTIWAGYQSIKND